MDPLHVYMRWMLPIVILSLASPQPLNSKPRFYMFSSLKRLRLWLLDTSRAKVVHLVGIFKAPSSHLRHEIFSYYWLLREDNECMGWVLWIFDKNHSKLVKRKPSKHRQKANGGPLSFTYKLWFYLFPWKECMGT